MQTIAVDPRWRGQTVIVAAPGPSLTEDVADRCKGFRTIAVQDAWRRLPWSDVLYFCDAAWFRTHDGCGAFNGEIWTTHDSGSNDKRGIADQHRLHCVAGKGAEGFSTDPAVIHYGGSSGFQAVNLALLFGARRVAMVGFDMRCVDGKAHFFGCHPKPLRTTTSYGSFIAAFEKAARTVPPGVTIVNCTPGSALKAFPTMSLDDALALEAA